MRNIGISAHIDSGKTTLTERILFYCGKTHSIHEVRGKDGVGAKMDHMELEREKGITIQSAATYTTWKEWSINIIDTPGHVDFTIEVERSLRVLDGAVLVLCGVAGVQSQSLTVDRQMKRYNIPRLAFINKLDRTGANPYRGLADIRKMLRLNAAFMQIPIGAESHFKGVVDLVTLQAKYFEGPNGESVVEAEIPEELKEQAAQKRQELIETVAEVDELLGEKFLEGSAVTNEELKAAVRRATLMRTFVPVFMGSAFKNKAVQALLDGVGHYLPNPSEVENTGRDLDNKEAHVVMHIDAKLPFVGYAFKLEEGKFGQVTYVRVYQGSLRKGDTLWDTVTRKKVKVPRVVKMHADEMVDVPEVGPGEIAAIFGVDCTSGTTFCAPGTNYSMTSMHVPKPVISLALKPKSRDSGVLSNFSKALNRFQKEDPTFKISFDAESQETIMSGMGELHLEVYAERLKREYNCETIVGNPQVNYRETISQRADFEFTHKKQSGGAGQYAKIIGYVEPVPADDEAVGATENEFINGMSGNNVPPEFIPAIEKGFIEACQSGASVGAPIQKMRFVITDGASHSVDSSELAFRVCTIGGIRSAMKQAGAQVLEPIMKVEVESPAEFQTSVLGGINKRRALIDDVGSKDGIYTVVRCTAPLKEMFGYSTELRSSTEGKGEFSMEYSHHAPVMFSEQEKLEKAFLEKSAKKAAKDS